MKNRSDTPFLNRNYFILDGECRSNFTKGGVNLHSIPKDARDSEIAFNKNREGYYGWFGYGGSLVQWHPELKIGKSTSKFKISPLDGFHLNFS